MRLWAVQVVAIGSDRARLDEVAALLRAAGAETITETQPNRALTTILGVLPSVVLMFAGADELPAADLVRALRTQCPERGGRIPVIAIGETRHHLHVQAMIRMPIRPARLLATVEAWVGVEVERRGEQRLRADWPVGVTRNRRWTPRPEPVAAPQLPVAV